MRVKAWGHEPESPCGNKSVKSQTAELRQGWREPHCGQELLIFLDKRIMMWNRSHAAHRVQGSFSCSFSWRDRFEHKLFFFFFPRKMTWHCLVEMWFAECIWLSEGMVKEIKLSREPKAVNNRTEKLISLGKSDSSLHDMSYTSVLWLDTHTKKAYKVLNGMPRHAEIYRNNSWELPRWSHRARARVGSRIKCACAHRALYSTPHTNIPEVIFLHHLSSKTTFLLALASFPREIRRGAGKLPCHAEYGAKNQDQDNGSGVPGTWAWRPPVETRL